MPLIKCVPGEHDAGLDKARLYRQFLSESHYLFDHHAVHFVALDNLTRAKPEIGAEQFEQLNN